MLNKLSLISILFAVIALILAFTAGVYPYTIATVIFAVLSLLLSFFSLRRNNKR